ncbi:MAG: monooxygenase [Neisseria sp.]|nr:monooxygenase [Neisseria sp.]
MIILQCDFDFVGDLAEQTEAMRPLAESICREPGFIWKIWTGSTADGKAGGIYLFDTREHAQAYAAMHEQRLAAMGVVNFRALILDVQQPLSAITRAPL